MKLSSLFYALPVVTAAITAPINDAAPGPTVYLNAIGMGVANRAASTTFYGKMFGVKKQMSMPVANMGQGGWTEDINIFPGPHSSALVLMEWTDKRPHKDLPLKLRIAVKDPKGKQALIAQSGGKALDMKTESSPDAVYAKDPNGYLLELVGGADTAVLKSVGIGVSNLNQSGEWWGGVTGVTKGPLKKYAEWDSISLKPDKASELLFMNWHETPKRNTKNMPIKVVIATSSQSKFTKAIQSANPKGKAAGAMSMFQWEPIEHTLIEINGGAKA